MPAAPVLDSPPGSRPPAADEPVQVRLLFDPASERIIDVAGAVRTLLQYDAEQLRGQSLSTLIEPLPGQRSLPWSAAQPGDSADESLVTVLTRHGLRHLVSAQATAFRRADGGVMGLLLLSDWVRHESGALGRTRQRRRLQTLAYELTVAESRERERVANGLHDTLGQVLAIAQFRLDELRAALPESPLQQRAGELAELLAQASAETRRATFELHPPLLRHLGLGAAIEGVAERLCRRGGLVIKVSGGLDPGPLEAAAQAVVLRVVRELLLNAYKHARASSVTVHLSCVRHRLIISVIDDGCGCADLASRMRFSPQGGFGLASAEAQMQALGGRLELSSAAGLGTTARITLGLRGAAARQRSSAAARPGARLAGLETRPGLGS